ncbi:MULTISPECIES: DUF3567 domain-containing protein [Comamonas]|jgi:hypothetical protein|uniref:BTH_I0359 family protein n=1 Tax=Comamonas TaxID=283 RepID=UPI0012BF6E12|nr:MULTISPECIES: DUF3567 domain-containing protein [Comamonas]MDR3066775.1 DUF3567 domain-containing protein [Comamonas sp.]MEB5963287.1 DUF3567 domain-containing protein [Comamonas testosteroni]MPS95465.1 DUF3567 domain-containing protein [Comamonas sp.]
MQMLYDSESFAVLHLRPDMEADAPAGTAKAETEKVHQLPRHGFEIVDKRSGKEVYLDGSWAEMFQKQILAWQQDAPTEEEVEEILDTYTGLAQQPVIIH